MITSRDEDEREFYIKYRADSKPNREPQTLPMAVGSAFDAEVKAFLLDSFHGKAGQFVRLYEAQVEPQNRVAALPYGKLYFEQYKNMGGLSDLCIMLREADMLPMVELDYRHKVNFDGVEINVNCKPDLLGENKTTTLIHDWKVNKGSPASGYVKSLPSGLAHKTTMTVTDPISGIRVAAHAEAGKKWDDQLSFYFLARGFSEDKRYIASIDQITHDGAPGPKTRSNQFRKVLQVEQIKAYATKVRKFWEAELARAVNEEWELLALARYGVQRPETEDDCDFAALLK
jgi:hypothetical protein